MVGQPKIDKKKSRNQKKFQINFRFPGVLRISQKLFIRDFNGFIKLELFAEMEIYFGSAILFDDENKIQPNIFSQKFLFLVGDCKGWVVGLVV